MRVEPNLYVIGSGKNGFDLTDPFDCNVYLFDVGDTYIVFDAGTGMGTDQILAVCQQDGLDPDQIDHLFVTHAHSDHGGGAAHLRERVSPAVYASAFTASILSTGDEEAVSLPAAKASGMYPKNYVYRPCPVVTGGDRRYLISGDAIFFGGKIILQNTYDCSVPDTIASIQRLADCKFDALLPGHLNFSLKNGRRHIEAACAIIDRLGCPQSIQ
jgi:glyoxylase-like metal-dependent hydrolase (beta-lactamase superfamily II)